MYNVTLWDFHVTTVAIMVNATVGSLGVGDLHMSLSTLCCTYFHRNATVGSLGVGDLHMSLSTLC